MHNYWAIDENAARLLAELTRTADLGALSSSSLDIPDPQASVENRVAIIPIKGILTKESASGFIRFLMGGGTSYQGIIERVHAADADPGVESIEYRVDSPGGSVNGFYEAAKVMKESSKPSVAVINGTAASAAYGLASQADKVIASNEADLVGSVGIVSTFYVSENVIDVTSTHAPFKAPDVKTKQGFNAVQEQLDMIHSKFVDAIADGRKTKADIVNKDFGRGMVLTADIAMRRGMVDSIGIEASAQNPASENIQDAKTKNLKTGGKRKMKLSERLSTDAEARGEHEAALAAATQQGTQQGADKERTRVKAHLASISHSSEVVIKAIGEGTPYDEVASAAYMNAGMAAVQGKKRVLDNNGAVVTDDGDDTLDGDVKAKAVAAVVDKALELPADSGAGILG